MSDTAESAPLKGKSIVSYFSSLKKIEEYRPCDEQFNYVKDLNEIVFISKAEEHHTMELKTKIKELLREMEAAEDEEAIMALAASAKLMQDNLQTLEQKIKEARCMIKKVENACSLSSRASEYWKRTNAFLFGQFLLVKKKANDLLKSNEKHHEWLTNH